MNKKSAFRTLFAMFFLGMGLVPFLFSNPAAVDAQAVLPTPTPQADGRIIYIAQEGDTWWSISIKMNVNQDELYNLNNAKADDPVIAGAKIVIGVVTATEVPTEMAATATPNILTPVVKGYGEICVVLFDDTNGNASRDTDEAMLAGGAVSLVDKTGQTNKTGQTTSGPDPVCFDQLPEGDYNLSLAVPDGYNATTSLNSPLKLVAGDKSTMNFGAQSKAAAQPTTPTNPNGGRNPMIAIVGGVLILGGIGAGIFFLRMRK